ncbi:MAG: RNA 2',3'-cyclic phosphodiesterase [Proteobacteria bacterium]|nr:RNA 2',3'-cyclic phosphodiesterase [Pseudomonadota bacterium]
MRPLKDVRIFFALWPDDEVRHRIAENLRLFNLDSNKSRLVTNANLHMTLHFVGNASFAEMNCLNLQARLTEAKPFSLTLDCSGYFKKPQVLWFGCHTMPEALYDLQRQLGEHLKVCAYTPESRPYSPHVTVARKIFETPETVPIKPISWQVDRFVLVKSISISGGVRYEVVESYALGC